MAEHDINVILTTLRLAGVVTVFLLLLAIPLAWWLSQTHSRWKGVVGALFSLPLVLPPTVLGFYLLLAMGPNGPLGQFFANIGFEQLPFSFSGIAIACVIHSLPFVVQPLQNAFEAIGVRPLEVAATLRASPWSSFWCVAMPLAWPGIFAAAIMGFCHTLGEFGIVLMIGGNIPGKTQVVSVEIYNHVEALEYDKAHLLAGGMVVFSFIALLAIYGLNYKQRVRH